MVVIGKILKWLGIALLAYIVWIFVSYTVKSSIVTTMFEWKMKYEGVKMQKNEWQEFDLDSVTGETPASLFGGLQQGQSILKYTFNLMYPFDGKVGFVGGSDREQQSEECFNKKDLDTWCAEKNEQAYIFRTIDDGQTFIRQTLGHGIVNGIKKLEGSYFLNVHEADTYKDHTLRSDDFGKSWNKLGNFRIEAMFDKDKFIYAVNKVISRGNRENTYYYTKDGGKTAKLLDKKILAYQKKSLTRKFEVYKGHLAFLIDEIIVVVNVDTLEETKTVLKRPPYQKLIQLSIDTENGELYITTEHINAKPLIYRLKQESIWYPFSNILVEFDKLPNDLVLLHVKDSYIGGLVRYRGLLTHVWTMDKGKEWKFEVLPHYFWESSFTGNGNGRIYMRALVQGKDGVKKGSYLIMGKIK